jgi:hypothetical protein
MTDLDTPQPYVYVAARQLTAEVLERAGLAPASSPGHTCSPGTCGCGETDPPWSIS